MANDEWAEANATEEGSDRKLFSEGVENIDKKVIEAPKITEKMGKRS